MDAEMKAREVSERILSDMRSDYPDLEKCVAAVLEEAWLEFREEVARIVDRWYRFPTHYRDELAAAIRALHPSSTPGPKDEQAWLVERRNPAPEWLTASSAGFDWSKDSLEAIRFSRRSDANQIAEIFDNEDVRILEHMWPAAESKR